MENKRCSICFSEITNKNRLIVEGCGHTKCRNCFITEESSCKQCLTINSEVKIVQNILISPKNSIKKTIKQHIVNMGDQYRCTICDKIFRSRQQQYYHLHCDEPEESRPYKCGECSRGFLKESHLKYHINTHSMIKCICNFCKKEFSNKASLDKHFKRHKQHAKYKCDTCQAEYKDENYFKLHLNSHNASPNNRFSCNTCNKFFFVKSQLKRHVVIHKKDRVKLFECDICDSKFFRASSLKDHLTKHSNVHKFKCNICYKQFTEEKALRRHKVLHNNVIAYQCGICDTKLNRKDNLIRHIRNMHPDCNVKNTSNIFSKEKHIENLEIIKMENTSSQTFKNEKKMDSTGVVLNQYKSSGNGKSTFIAINGEENYAETDKKYIQCSVIKSIGNAKPLDVVLSPRNNEKSLSKPTISMNPINISVLANKKLKKKYDPTEIYRKILFVNNEDTFAPCVSNDAIERDKIKFKSDSKMKTTILNLKDDTTYTHSNFIEKHWRKNFYS